MTDEYVGRCCRAAWLAAATCATPVHLQVQVLTVDQVWKGGKLVDRNEYRDEQIVDEEDDDEVEEEVCAHPLL